MATPRDGRQTGARRARFDGRRERRRRRLATFAVGEVGDRVALVQRASSRLCLREQVARVVEAEVCRALLSSTQPRLALTVRNTMQISK